MNTETKWRQYDDEWNKAGSDMTFHDKDKVEALLSDMEIVKLEEVTRDGILANDQPKHWHLFNIIARKT